jgi:hypothetical protein
VKRKNLNMQRILRAAMLALPLALPLSAAAYDVNGVKLGGTEADVKRVFPSAYCKALEWKTDAADRRCDDAQISLAGIETRLTAYMKGGIVQGFDLRFDMKDLDRGKAALESRWGKATSEATEVFSKKDKPDRKVLKMRWEKGADHAILTAQMDKKRVTVEIWRGRFAEEIHRIR